MFNEWFEKLTDLRAFDDIIKRAESHRGSGGFFAQIRDEIGIKPVVSETAYKAIPRKGPLIVVANHPTGFAEGLVIPALLDEIRDDGFVLGHTFFERWPALAARMILVNPQAPQKGASQNARAIVRAARRIRNGGCMLIFPAGQVARPANLSLQAREGSWQKGLAKIAYLSGAPILPVHISGSTSLLFRAASLLHPRLGVPFLFREVINARHQAMMVTVGPIVSSREFHQNGSAEEAVAYMRSLVSAR